MYHPKLSEKRTLSIDRVGAIQIYCINLLNDSATLWKKGSESAGGGHIPRLFILRTAHKRK
jgi:hypothetical protein